MENNRNPARPGDAPDRQEHPPDYRMPFSQNEIKDRGQMVQYYICCGAVPEGGVIVDIRPNESIRVTSAGNDPVRTVRMHRDQGNGWVQDWPPRDPPNRREDQGYHQGQPQYRRDREYYEDRREDHQYDHDHRQTSQDRRHNQDHRRDSEDRQYHQGYQEEAAHEGHPPPPPPPKTMSRAEGKMRIKRGSDAPGSANQGPHETDDQHRSQFQPLPITSNPQGSQPYPQNAERRSLRGQEMGEGRTKKSQGYQQYQQSREYQQQYRQPQQRQERQKRQRDQQEQQKQQRQQPQAIQQQEQQPPQEEQDQEEQQEQAARQRSNLSTETSSGLRRSKRAKTSAERQMIRENTQGACDAIEDAQRPGYYLPGPSYGVNDGPEALETAKRKRQQQDVLRANAQATQISAKRARGESSRPRDAPAPLRNFDDEVVADEPESKALGEELENEERYSEESDNEEAENEEPANEEPGNEGPDHGSDYQFAPSDEFKNRRPGARKRMKQFARDHREDKARKKQKQGAN